MEGGGAQRVHTGRSMAGDDKTIVKLPDSTSIFTITLLFLAHA